MTFDEKRSELLVNLDKCYSELHKLLSDRTLTNDAYPPYLDAIRNFELSMKHLLTLNQAENL